MHRSLNWICIPLRRFKSLPGRTCGPAKKSASVRRRILNGCRTGHSGRRLPAHAVRAALRFHRPTRGRGSAHLKAVMISAVHRMMIGTVPAIGMMMYPDLMTGAMSSRTTTILRLMFQGVLTPLHRPERFDFPSKFINGLAESRRIERPGLTAERPRRDRFQPRFDCVFNPRNNCTVEYSGMRLFLHSQVRHHHMVGYVKAGLLKCFS